jgi:hypothetical protein
MRGLIGLIAGCAFMGGTVSFGATKGTHVDPAAPGVMRYTKFEAKNYVLEVPEGWEVGAETPFGQREILPGKKANAAKGSSMSLMTGPGLGQQSWDQLYQTSLYFITRYAPAGGKMTATPFKVSKTKQGFEACTWTMADQKGIAVQRHVILKDPSGGILALSVKIPASAGSLSQDRLNAIFQRTVDTAIVR